MWADKAGGDTDDDALYRRLFQKIQKKEGWLVVVDVGQRMEMDLIGGSDPCRLGASIQLSPHAFWTSSLSPHFARSTSTTLSRICCPARHQYDYLTLSTTSCCATNPSSDALLSLACCVSFGSDLLSTSAVLVLTDLWITVKYIELHSNTFIEYIQAHFSTLMYLTFTSYIGVHSFLH